MTVSFVGVLLVVGSALAYSTLDLVRKLLVARISGATLLVYLSIGQLPFFAGWMMLAGSGAVDRGYALPAAASIVLNIAANLLFMEAVRLSPLSLTIPFLALTPVFTTLLGVPLLGEVPRPVQWVGIAVVVLGAFRLNAGRGPGDGRWGWGSLVAERGSLLMVFVALSWSLAMPLDKIALGLADAPTHGLVLNAGVGVGLFAVLLVRGRVSEVRALGQSLGLMAVAVSVSVFGLAFLLMALGYLWVAVAETLRRAIGSIAALLLGRLIFEEPITSAKVAGVALMTLGVAMILL
ncbi:MAG: DMT family transporter [Acidimicrobiia bacterium]|nr:DMT family transporter [Acidimicrobiia bacterium]